MEEKQLYYFLAVKEILELFAEQEIGPRCEINVGSVLSYVKSMKFVNDTWGLRSKEEIYKLVTDDILAGYPVWQLLDMPDWTRDMIEREFNLKQEQKQKELERKYKCYTCKWFREHNTSAGYLAECKKPKDAKDWRLRRDYFEPKKRCKYYEKKEKV